MMIMIVYTSRFVRVIVLLCRGCLVWNIVHAIKQACAVNEQLFYKQEAEVRSANQNSDNQCARYLALSLGTAPQTWRQTGKMIPCLGAAPQTWRQTDEWHHGRVQLHKRRGRPENTTMLGYGSTNVKADRCEWEHWHIYCFSCPSEHILITWGSPLKNLHRSDCPAIHFFYTW